MKNYRIIVNGNEYDVAVEEVGSSSETNTASVMPKPTVSKAPAAPKKSAPPAPKGSEGGIKVKSPMPGKIISLKANVGDDVKKGQVILILEAMKMENEVVAPQDGKIVSFNVAAGKPVEAGEVLATIS